MPDCRLCGEAVGGRALSGQVVRLSKKIASHPLYLRIKLLLKRLSGRELRIRSDVTLETDSAGGWTFSKNHLGHGSIAYSFGIGDFIAFDLLLIEVYGSTVHAFDPTPTSVESIKNQDLTRQFVFHPWAVAGSDGVLRMTQRVNRKGRKSKTMWTSVLEPSDGAEVIEVPCFSLASIMKKLNHKTIDLLKIDVEGSEYEIIESLIVLPNKPGQLLIEFHHRFPNIGLERTAEAIRKLRAVGYGVFAVSLTGREISFIHESRLSGQTN